MSLLTLKEIHVSFGPQVVLENVDFTLHPGDRVGVVGPNGAGKSTLLAVLLGWVRPSIGQVHLARGMRVGHLPQEVTPQRLCQPDPPDAVALGAFLRGAFATTDQLADAIGRVGEQIAQADETDREPLLRRLARLQAELDAAGGYHYESKIGLVRDGLGLSDIEPDRPMTGLSGGQLSRAALARLLLTEPDLLLLDEPTNHLDLAATEWLERFLLEFSGAMMIVSHDRYLLDKVAGKVLEVNARRARLFAMHYRDYVTTCQIQQLQQQREFEKQQEFIAKERDFIARFHAGQRGREARGRRTRLERRIKSGELAAERVHTPREFSFQFRIAEPGGQMIVRCAGVSKRYEARVLFDRFDWEVTRGQKVGLCGPNGVGKTTLLRMMLNQVEPDSGRVRLMENLDIGYLDQHLATMEQDAGVLSAAHKVRPDMSAQHLRGLLARFGFAGEAIEKRVGSLSGGEQSRLALAAMVLAGHQVLLLDEPTNHLDTSAREALEEALREYPGTLIVVSHDRYFLDRVVDHLLIMGQAGLHVYFEGNYSAWQQRLAEQARKAEQQAARHRAEARRSAARAARTSPRPTGPPPGADWPDELKPLAALSLAKLEERIIQMEFELERLHNQFADTAIYDDPARVAEVGRQVHHIQQELGRYNAAWERRAQ